MTRRRSARLFLASSAAGAREEAAELLRLATLRTLMRWADGSADDR